MKRQIRRMDNEREHPCALGILCHWQHPWAEVVFKSPRSFIEEIGHKQHLDQACTPPTMQHNYHA